MGISSYIPSITVADPGRGHNHTLWGICLEVVKKWLIQFSRFYAQYENDKMGLWCLQRKIHKTELLLLAQICTKSFVDWGFSPEPTGGAYNVCSPDPLAGLRGGAAHQGNGKEEGKGDEGMRGEAGHPQIFRWIDAFG